jgi:AcrR family transcriptional regulator
MARPRNSDAARTKKRILEAAGKLFSRKGLHAVGMREVASAARVSQPAVHHYFGSKEELHDAVLDAMYEELSSVGKELQSVIFGAETLEAAVDGGVRKLFRFALEHRDAVLLAMRESLDASKKIRAGRAQLVGNVLLDQAASAIAEIAKRPTDEIKMALLSINFLLSRYITLSPNERKLLVEPALAERLERKPTAAEVDTWVETHLANAAVRLVL